MTIIVTRTKSDLRLAWDIGELPFASGDRLIFDWSVAESGAATLTPKRVGNSKSPLVRPYRGTKGRLEVAWSSGLSEIPCFGPVAAEWSEGQQLLLPNNPPVFIGRVHNGPRKQPKPAAQSGSVVGNALEAIKALNVRLQSLVEEVNEAKALLGEGAELSIHDGKLRFDFIMGFGG
jgi:hypothetical protein